MGLYPETAQLTRGFSAGSQGMRGPMPIGGVERICPVRSPLSGNLPDPKRLPPPRFVRFWRITLKVFRFLGDWQRPACLHLYIERCRNGPWKTRRAAKRPCIRPTKQIIRPDRRGGRVVEGAPLLREYTSKAYRGFESLPLRHFPLVGSPQRIALPARIICRAFRHSLPPSARPEKGVVARQGTKQPAKIPYAIDFMYFYRSPYVTESHN